MDWYAASRALAAAVALNPCSASPPEDGSASGLELEPAMKSVEPAIDVTTGKVPFMPGIRSAMRPPQPLRLGPDETADCHWFCWSECEKRLSGRVVREFAFVVGPFSGPTLARIARRP